MIRRIFGFRGTIGLDAVGLVLMGLIVGLGLFVAVRTVYKEPYLTFGACGTGLLGIAAYWVMAHWMGEGEGKIFNVFSIVTTGVLSILIGYGLALLISL